MGDVEDSSSSTDSKHSDVHSRTGSLKSEDQSIEDSKGKCSSGHSVKRDSSILGLNSAVQTNSTFDHGLVPPQTASWESSGAAFIRDMDVKFTQGGSHGLHLSRSIQISICCRQR
eukprot:764054-Hanusia_phi.AAC.8